MVDLDRPLFRINFCYLEFLVFQKRGEATSRGLLQEIAHGDLGRGGMILKEVFQQPWREEGEVGDDGIFDGEDGGMYFVGSEEEFRGDLKKSGGDGEA